MEDAQSFSENQSQLPDAPSIADKRSDGGRNIAFDIARIVAMFLIVSTHFLGHGGFIDHMVGANFVFGRILYSLFSPSVNVFVLISAYFTCRSTKLNWRKLIKLYAQVWTYSVALFIAFIIVNGIESFSVQWLLSSLFPVVSGKYWFFSAYIFMMLASPFLNVIIGNIDKKTHFAICIFAIVAGILSSDVHIVPQLSLEEGFSVAWFILLYFIGAFIRKYDVKVPKKWIFIPILVYVATFIAGYFLNSSHASIIRTAPAVIILLALKDIKMQSGAAAKFVVSLSSKMFGVYLIHDSNEMRSYMYENIFHCSEYYQSKYAFLIMLGFITVTFIVCIMIEEVRQGLESIIETVIPLVEKHIRKKSKKKSNSHVESNTKQTTTTEIPSSEITPDETKAINETDEQSDENSATKENAFYKEASKENTDFNK